MLKKLKRTILAFNAKWRAKGEQTGQWTCVHCGKQNETILPGWLSVDEKGYWDSAKTCYECGEQSFVVMYPNGIIATERL